MAAPGWIELFVRPLEALSVPHMVTGSVASMIDGEPRLTLDLDLVVEIGAEGAEALLEAFPEAELDRPPLELDRALLEGELRERGLEEAWRKTAPSG